MNNYQYKKTNRKVRVKISDLRDSKVRCSHVMYDVNILGAFYKVCPICKIQVLSTPAK
jgi:hypothetical protein